MNKCQSCGMPMEVVEDFGGGNTGNLYCKYCTDESGNLLPRETVKERMTGFYVKAMNETPEIAATKVDQIMATMPAWQQTPATNLQPEAAAPSFSYEPAPVVEPVEPQVPVASEPISASPQAEPELPLPEAVVSDETVQPFTTTAVPFNMPASPEPMPTVPEPSLPEPIEPQIIEPTPVTPSPLSQPMPSVEEKIDDEIPLPPDPGQ